MFVTFFCGIFIIINADMITAYVYCQDANAMPWVPLGYSCPVNCASIAAAVERLKALDYKLSMKKQLVLPNPNNTRFGTLRHKDFNKTHFEEFYKKHIEVFYKILHQNKAIKELKALVKRASILRQDCYLLNGVQKLLSGCGQSSGINGTFLRDFTSTLNRYSNREFPFDLTLAEDMIKIIYGLEFNPDSGIFDVSRILKYLRGAMAQHRLNEQRNGSTITLRSRYCLNVYVPGCFCMPGYVEHSGQCLPPQACYPDTPGITEYLHRIIIH